jgi:hypothetical protein
VSLGKATKSKENPFMGSRGIAEALLNLKLRESKNSKFEDEVSSKKASLIESRTGSNDIDDISFQNNGGVTKVGGKPLSNYGGHKKTSSLKYSENTKKEIGKYFVSNASRHPKPAPSLYYESLYYKSTPYTKPPLEEHYREEPELFSQTAPFQLNDEKMSRKSIFKTGEESVKMNVDKRDQLSIDGADNSIFGDQTNLKFRKKRTLHCLLNQANETSLLDRPNEEGQTPEVAEKGKLDQSGVRNLAVRPKPF